jgi:hypothetical protein
MEASKALHALDWNEVRFFLAVARADADAPPGSASMGCAILDLHLCATSDCLTRAT